MVTRNYRNRQRVMHMKKEEKKYKLIVDEEVVVSGVSLDVVMGVVDVIIDSEECKTIYIRQLEVNENEKN